MAEVSKEQIAQVMGAIGSIRTEKKTEKSRANLETARAVRWEGDRREQQSEAQRERRKREREAREAAAALLPPVEKRPPGRPRKDPTATTSATSSDTSPKRGRGRPPKATPPPEG